MRRVKCKKKQLRKEKLMNAMLEGDRIVFDEMRKLKGTNKKRSTVVDGLTNDGDIVSLFKDQNQTLLNSCNYNNDSFKNMMQSVQDQILCNESNWQHVNISRENVTKATQYLKRDKADGVVDLVSNNFINGPDCMIMYFRDFYACCLHHDFMPEATLLLTIIPIPNDPNVTDQKSDSYKGIALSALCTKVFEYVILNMHSDSLISNNLQFVYKAGMSTTQCTWAARKVISHYNNMGSDVYCCLLDCSKTFDLIKLDRLLEKLVAKDVPPVIYKSVDVYVYKW